MKYILLTGSIIFGIAGISQAMDAIMAQGLEQITNCPIVYDLQYFTLSFAPIPGFIKVLILSIGFFSMFIIWKKIKQFEFGKLRDYTPY